MTTRGDWFQTFTGIQFYPLDPRPEDIDLLDIAHALANQCRYAGHCRVFFSTAQHSIMVSRVVPGEPAIVGLLYDAAEAYCHDLTRPMKLALRASTTAYDDIELGIERVIAKRFGLPAPPWPAAVKAADNVALMTERRDLMAVQRVWTERAEPLPERIIPLDPLAAERAFLDRATLLCVCYYT